MSSQIPLHLKHEATLPCEIRGTVLTHTDQG